MSKKYSTSEAAKLLGVSFVTIKRWVYNGKIEAKKDQRGWWRIEEEEIGRIKAELLDRKKGIPSNILSLMSLKKVAYLRELQVCFEEDFLHKDTYSALVKLAYDGKISTKSEFDNRWFYLNSLSWSDVEQAAKEKSELAKVYMTHPRRFEKDGTVYMDYSEYLVEQALIAASYVVISKDSYYFNGKTYRPSTSAGRPKDLDFIAKVPQKEVFLGIQVKNKMQHPTLSEVVSLIDICTALQLKPILVGRIIHPGTYELLKDNGGRALKFIRYFLQPPFPRDKFSRIVDLGIPLGVYQRVPDFLVNMFNSLAGFV